MVPLSIDTNISNLYDLVFSLIISIASIPSRFYLLIFIPTIIIILLKIYTEKVWFELNRESERVFNERLDSFRDKRSLYKLFEKVKERKLNEFRKFILEYIKKSPMSFIIFGVIFLQIILSILTAILDKSQELVVVYLIPLSMAWLFISVFLTVFEGQISNLTKSFIEVRKFSKQDYP